MSHTQALTHIRHTHTKSIAIAIQTKTSLISLQQINVYTERRLVNQIIKTQREQIKSVLEEIVFFSPISIVN